MACYFFFQVPAVWVNLSVMYWARVMVTKQRTLIILKNLMPTDVQQPVPLKLRVSTRVFDN